MWVSGFNGNVLSEVNATTGAVLFTSGYTANGLEQPYSIAVDASNNIWLPNQYDPNTLVGATVSEFNSTGGAVGVYGGGGILGPDGVAIVTVGAMCGSRTRYTTATPSWAITAWRYPHRPGISARDYSLRRTLRSIFRGTFGFRMLRSL